jgi:hypothetical protein
VNERIRELYEQARLHAQTVNADLDPKGWMDEYHKKFAELIVRECLDIVNRHEYSYHEADPLWETAQLIKEHFGVDL